MGRPLRERPISYLPSSCPSSGARLLFERRFIRGVLSHRSLQRPSERRPDSRAGEADRRQGIEHQTDRAVEEHKPVAVEAYHRMRTRLLDLPPQHKARSEGPCDGKAWVSTGSSRGPAAPSQTKT